MNSRLLTICLVLCPLATMAQKEHSSLFNKLFYKEILQLENPMSGTSNPIRTSYIPFEASTNVALGYMNQSGEFHALHSAEQLHSYNLNISGNKKLGKMAFEGFFDYTHNKELQRRWNSTLLIAPDNPFILADSIRGDFTVETFSLAGSMAYTFNPQWEAGINVSYTVGSSADQTDPRPETNGMHFRIAPGVMYNTDRWSFGLSGSARWMSESITYTSVLTTKNYTLFLFNGMGMYDGRTTLSYHRRYAGATYGGELQLLFRPHSQASHLLEIGANKATEDAIDGAASSKFRGGLYKRTLLTIKEESRWSSGSYRHTLNPMVQLANIDGTWFTQKQTTDKDGNVIWEVKDQSICHTEQRMDASLQYRMDRVVEQIPTLSTLLTVGYSQSTTRHYPEELSQQYSLAHINAAATKHWLLSSSRISTTLGANYTHSLGSNIEGSGITLQKQYTQPLLAYNAASTVGIKGRMEYSIMLPKPINGSTLNIFADYNYRHYLGDNTFFINTTQHLVLTGISWIF